ncbi:MAG: esterase family protein [Anaerolineales bacterium]|nr:esterase family protein [Anaerolineales bacterium]
MVSRWVWAGVCLLLCSGCWQAETQVTATAVTVTPATPFQVHLPISVASQTATPIPTPQATPTATRVSCSEPGEVQQLQLTSRLAGTLNYRLYTPPCYGADGYVYPVLYLLPGNIHTDAIWDELGIDEAAETAVLQNRIPPFLIVMPDGGWLANNTSGGPGSYEDMILSELVPHIEATTCAWVDKAGRAIGGLSRGGYWALEIAFLHPEIFVSVGGHSAALLDTYAGPTINPQDTGPRQNPGSLRIYLDIGVDDYVRYPLLQLHEEMAQAEIPHEWVLNSGTHEEAYWQAHLDDYLTWYAQAWSTTRSAYPVCTK